MNLEFPPEKVFQDCVTIEFIDKPTQRLYLFNRRSPSSLPSPMKGALTTSAG